MVCTHNIQHLIGKSDGIHCRNCGRRFDNFDEVENDRKSSNLAANTEDSGEADISIEKEKKTAVPAQNGSAKGAKMPKKKTVSTKSEGAK